MIKTVFGYDGDLDDFATIAKVMAEYNFAVSIWVSMKKLLVSLD
jgi:hypothetical protein